MSHAILLVDADESTTAFLADQLAADGYQAVVARTLDAVFALADTAVDVVVLGDLAERRHALRLLDDVRGGTRPFDPDVLVMVLSAHAEALDVLRAFDHGADDVVTKPVGYSELRARIAALLRRRRSRRGEILRVRDLEIDTRARRVRLAGEPIALTQREFTLLVHLAAEPSGCSPRPNSPPSCGATPRSAPRARSTPTSPACATSSAPTATARG
jgi:DNA-binding response OmpR family regulator